MIPFGSNAAADRFLFETAAHNGSKVNTWLEKSVDFGLNLSRELRNYIMLGPGIAMFCTWSCFQKKQMSQHALYLVDLC